MVSECSEWLGGVVSGLRCRAWSGGVVRGFELGARHGRPGVWPGVWMCVCGGGGGGTGKTPPPKGEQFSSRPNTETSFLPSKWSESSRGWPGTH